MDDYISRQAVVNKCGDWYVEEGIESGFIGFVNQMLDMFPAADVVPVVRCRGCRYHVDSDKCCHPDGLLCAKDNNFCGYGERREE